MAIVWWSIAGSLRDARTWMNWSASSSRRMGRTLSSVSSLLMAESLSIIWWSSATRSSSNPEMRSCCPVMRSSLASMSVRIRAISTS